ncbi:hypothetical protein [Methylocaldum sp.]|uniref:hypothetical protein n=1 Tax=Methylocaldum sp. TaxID=1969727 RepID=UPI002D5021E6|nr:hypothetical protein [Methylocaldum sp.]HYE38224.1 hypothetical protein [Methylocaldum sp.]
MPSSATTRNRFEKQAAGENLNTWGAPKLNTVFDLIDASLDGWTSFALSGTKTLTSTNYASDESRARCLNVSSGTGGTVTIPAVEKVYLVRNASSGDVIITTGGSTNATVKTGEVRWVISDGTDCLLAKYTDLGGDKLTNVGTPTADADACTKAYADNLALSAASGNLPGQEGNAGYFLTTNGTSASWAAAMAATNNLSELTNTTTARSNLGLGTAATKNTGTSGANVPLLSTVNTWGATQAFAALQASGTATFSGAVSKGSGGHFLYNGSSSYASGKVTFSTSSASGGSSGDIWFKYTA